MSLISAKVGGEVVSALLRGAHLDTIRIYSLVMQLGFIRSGTVEGLPSEIWVSLSGNLWFEGAPSVADDLGALMDFFERRASILGAVYLLMGKEVTAAGVADSGALQIKLGGTCLRVEADKDTNLEEVWAVSSDLPETTADHRWYVSLDDSGALSARTPS